MLESLTIFNKGGLIVYQYAAQPSLFGADDSVAHTREALNSKLLQGILLDPASSTQKTYHIAGRLTFLWVVKEQFITVALYPDIMFEGPRQYLKGWAQGLVQAAAHEYQIYYKAATAGAAPGSADSLRPDPAPYDKTFKVLLQKSKTERPTTAPDAPKEEAAAPAPAAAPASTKSKKPGKEKRNWHDGNAKVTEKAMAELDMSKKNGESAEDGMQRALAEARQAYLPDEHELQEEETTTTSTEKTWSSSVTGLLSQLTGNKVLTDADLDGPLKSMQNLLVSKNVATDIAQQLCQNCRAKLVGKKLNSLYRVQTAIQQAMETVLTKLLHNKVDLLRAVMTKRGDGAIFSTSKRAPYVISVMGINGIGKTTSLAKLAWYFQQNGCKPLLVAGDTFRSGAVEQLKVHAACLNVPIYSSGYSKDPSVVAQGAIQQATQDGNDVVLIDTAGRMQNNVPLMKALGKLVQENKPDFVVMACEALVGHDGLNQYTMFKNALGSRGIDGLILTKFDTVSDKVGASLTLTHETGCPIVFCGVGQKYHHLKKLSADTVIQSLFS